MTLIASTDSTYLITKSSLLNSCSSGFSVVMPFSFLLKLSSVVLGSYYVSDIHQLYISTYQRISQITNDFDT